MCQSVIVFIGRRYTSIWFIHSVHLVIHLPFIYTNHSHPIGALALIDSLWTANYIEKTIFQQI